MKILRDIHAEGANDDSGGAETVGLELDLLRRAVSALQAIARAVRVNEDHQGGATVVDYGLGSVGLTGAKRSTGGIVEPRVGGERLYSTEEAAEILQLNVQTVRKHLRIRKIGGHCDRSGRWWIRQSDIEAFLTARRKVHGA